MQKEVIFDDISHILKGIQYLYGYSQEDLAKNLNVGQGSIQRWKSCFVKNREGY